MLRTSHQLPFIAECVPSGPNGEDIFAAVYQSMYQVWCVTEGKSVASENDTLLSSSVLRKVSSQSFLSAHVHDIPKSSQKCVEKPQNRVEPGFVRYHSEVHVWIINDFSLDLDVRRHQIDILRVLVTQAAGEAGGVRETKDRWGAEGVLHRQPNKTGQVNSQNHFIPMPGGACCCALD